MQPAGEKKAIPGIVMALGAWFIIVAVVNFAVGGLFGSQVVFLCATPNIIFGILMLLFGVGIFMMKRWAWLLGMIFAILGFLWSIVLLAAYGMIADMAGDVDADIPGWLTAVFVLPFIFFLILLILEFMAKKHFEKPAPMAMAMPPPGYPPQQPPMMPPQQPPQQPPPG